jgi:hypothetical protein
VSFHTFTLPEDRCVRLLVKNLGRGMPESVVREELESLNFRVQGVMQLRSGLRDQDPTKNRPPHPNSLCRWRVGLRYQECDRSPNSAVCECRWSRMWPFAERVAGGPSLSDGALECCGARSFRGREGFLFLARRHCFLQFPQE